MHAVRVCLSIIFVCFIFIVFFVIIKPALGPVAVAGGGGGTAAGGAGSAVDEVAGADASRFLNGQHISSSRLRM